MIPGPAPANVRFAPNSGHKWVIEFMSAFDPKRTLTTLGGFEGGVLTVQLDEHAGGAVEVGDHERRARSTADSAGCIYSRQ